MANERIGLSNRIVESRINPIRGLEDQALRIIEKGKKVYFLQLGAPDTDTPDEILEEGINYLAGNSAIPYGPSVGNPELREEIANFYGKVDICGIRAENILVTQGASEGVRLAILAIADQDESILVPDPGYPNYYSIADELGVKVFPIPTNMEDGYHLKKRNEGYDQAKERILSYVREDTKALLWSSPSNPTGAIYNEEELKLLAEVAHEKGLHLVSDEVYKFFAYGNQRRNDLAIRAPSIYDILDSSSRENLITLDSSSKAFGFCGGRIGFLVADEAKIKTITNIASVRGSACTISQAALTAINKIKPEYFNKVRQEYRDRRDFLYKGLSDLSGYGVTVSSSPPEGGFYVIAQLEGIIAEKFCSWLVNDYVEQLGSDETVLMAPMRVRNGGFYLGDGGESEVRMAYVINRESLSRALGVLATALPMYRETEGL
jgi:aspartate aminotransferase